eukprot:gene5084-5325_t
MAAVQYARALQLKLSEAGLQGVLQADAFQALLQFVTEVQGDLDVLYSIFEQLKRSMETDGVITKGRVESAIRQLAGTTTTPDHVFIVDAFTVPRVRYDAINKRLAKVRMYQGRFSLLFQRLRRNKLFAPLSAVQVVLWVKELTRQ